MREAACCEHWAAVQTPVTVIIYWSAVCFFPHLASTSAFIFTIFFHSIPFRSFSFVHLCHIPIQFRWSFSQPNVYAFVCVVVFFPLVELLHLINYLPYTRLVLSMRATLLFICHSRKCVCLCVYNNTQFSMCVSMNEWMSKFALFVFLFIVIQHAICWFWKWNARFVVFLLFVFPFYNCYRVRACFCLTTLCVSFVILLCIHCLCVCVVLLCVSECVFYQLLATLLIKKVWWWQAYVWWRRTNKQTPKRMTNMMANERNE